MKKMLKKVIAILICAMTVFSLTPAAFAVDNCAVDIDCFVDDAYFIDGLLESIGQQEFCFSGSEVASTESNGSFVNAIKEVFHGILIKAIEWLCEINFN